MISIEKNNINNDLTSVNYSIISSNITSTEISCNQQNDIATLCSNELDFIPISSSKVSRRKRTTIWQKVFEPLYHPISKRDFYFLEREQI